MKPFDANTAKTAVFATVREELEGKNILIESVDEGRPWGGFFVIAETSLPTFIVTYFADQDIDLSNSKIRLKPKILIVAPRARLSWQYHHRRSELWRIVVGPVGAMLSETDAESQVKIYNMDEIIDVKSEERHRLIGLDNWGIVAEIWRHTDITNLSTEDDIVRISDDFGR